MKTKLYTNILLTALILSIGLSGCIEEFGNPDAPFDRNEQIVGTWTVTKVVQRDLLTENPLFQEVDITTWYDFDQYAITINADSTYAVTNTGNAPDFVIPDGTWALDNEEFPTAIVLTKEGSTSALNFSSLNSLTELNELHVSFIRKIIIPKEEAETEEDVVKNAVAYEYTLIQSN